MSKTAILAIKIVSDAKQGKKGVDEATSSVEKFQQKVGKFTVPAAAIVAGAGAMAKGFIGYASEAQQAVGGVETVFGKHAAEVQRRASQADQALGLSEAAYNSLATTVGGSLKAAGFAQEELGGKTDDLVTRASDLASVFGGTTTEATEAMGAALRGEFDSLERFGVFLNMAAVEAELARTGQDKLSGSALDAAKKQATYNLMMQQSADYAGNFAREADTAAGAEQRAAAARENAAAQLGALILPAYTSLMVILGQVAVFVSENARVVGILAGVVVGLATAVLAVNAALRIYMAVQTAWTVVTKGATIAQKALNAAMKANPIGLIITAATILIGLFVLLYNRSETFRNAVNAAGRLGQKALEWIIEKARALGSAIASTASSISSRFASMTSSIRSAWDSAVSRIRSLWDSATSKIKSAASSVGSVVGAVFRALVTSASPVISILTRIVSAFRSAGSAGSAAFNGVISTVRSLISWVSSAIDRVSSLTNIGSRVGSGIRSLFGWQRVAPRTVPLDGSPFYLTAAEASRLIPAMPLARPGRRERAGRGSITININGAIDPNRTARRVREILDLDDRRDGGETPWN